MTDIARTVEELDALYAKATPGPWTDWSQEGRNKAGDFLHSLCRTDAGIVGMHAESFHQCVAEVRGKTEDEACNNTRFIAAVVNAWPELSKQLRAVVADPPSIVAHKISDEEILKLRLAPWQAVPSVPDGWQLVPKEPTPSMCAAGFAVNEGEHDPTGVYRVMLAAAPSAGGQHG